MFKDEKDVIVNSALDIYHDYGVTMEEAMDVAIDTFDSSDLVDEEYEAQKEAVVTDALDIYHEYGVSMEEALDMAIDMANEDVSLAGAIGAGAGAVGLGAAAAGIHNFKTAPREDKDIRNYNIYSQAPSASDKFNKVRPGLSRVVMQGILKWLEDYKHMPDGPARTALADKISRAINDPIIREYMMSYGYWETIPDEIHARAAIRKQKKYAKAGRKVERKDAKLERKTEAWKNKTYAKDAYRDSKAEAKRAAKDAKRAAKESVYDLADEIYSNYDVTEDEAIEAACDQLGINFEDMLD